MIVSIAIAAERNHQGGSPAAPGAPAALGVVGRRRRDVAQVNGGEVADIDAKLHGRRAEQGRELADSECLPLA